MSKQPITTEKDADERLGQLFKQTALGIELEELMEELVPPENPYWGNSEDRSSKTAED